MATQWKMPAALVVKEPEVAVAEGAVPPASAMFAEAKAGVPVQVVSVGGKSWNVTVPVGLKPVTVAVSVIAAPRMTVSADFPYTTVFRSRAMVTGSTVQPEVTGVLLVSPL